MKKIIFIIANLLVFAKMVFAFDIYNLSIDNMNNRINVNFQINLKEQNIIKRYLDLGDNIFIDMDIKIVKKNKFFFDSNIDKKHLKISLKKDMIKGDYILIKNNKKKIYSDFNNLINDIKVFKESLGSWLKIKKGFDYKVVIEAEINYRQIPNWLKTIIFFWNFNLSGPYYYEMEMIY